MFLIKQCLSCNASLRFPIDKGKIKIKCVCGYFFIADPDSPDLYANSAFDLSYAKKRIRLRVKLRELFAAIKIKELYPRSVKLFFSIKYKISNFKLLPRSEQRKIIVIVSAIIILFLIIFYL